MPGLGNGRRRRVASRAHRRWRALAGATALLALFACFFWNAGEALRTTASDTPQVAASAVRGSANDIEEASASPAKTASETADDTPDFAQLFSEQDIAAARRAEHLLAHSVAANPDAPLAGHLRWPGARVENVAWSEPDAAGRFRRVTIVAPDDLPYRIRIEEMLTASGGAPYAPESAAPAATVALKPPAAPDATESAWSTPSPAPGVVLLAEELADRILVQLAPGAAPADATSIAESIGGTVDKQVSASGLYRVLLPSAGPDDAPAAALALTRAGPPGVEFAETDPIMRAALAPNDPKFTDGTLWGMNAIQAPAAWDSRTDATAVVVAVIDTGINFNHEDLRNNLWTNPGESGLDSLARDKASNGIDDDGNGYVDDVNGINAITNSGNGIDDNKHGSHVAGTIAGQGNNGVGVAGVAWRARLLTGKFLSSTGSGATSDAVQCVDYAVSMSAEVLSNSWGGGGFSQSLFNAISRARTADAIFVAAAGNDSKNTDSSANYPSNYALDNVVSVAALDSANNLASFSNYGALTVDIGAPGVSIYSCTNSTATSYQSLSGTSMATPHVAGAMALLRAHAPGLSTQEVITRFLSTATATASLAGKSVTGGRLNLAAAMNIAPTGALDVSLTAPSPLRSGQPGTVLARVTDVLPVNNAAITAATQPALAANFTPDSSTPGQYQATLDIPANITSIIISLNVSAPGKAPFSGNFTLPVITPPANDDFASAAALTGTDVSTTGTNADASKQSGEPSHAGNSGGRSVWWKWTSPGAGTVSVNTSGSSFDTLLGVYTGSSVSALTTRASNDDSSGSVTSALTFTAINGTTYYIAVDGYSGATGSIALRVSASWAAAPTFTTQPSNRIVSTPASTTFTVVASSATSYQWQRLPVGAVVWANLINGGNYANVTTATLTVTSTHAGMSGDKFRCVATNTFGSATSNSATLTVNGPPANDNLPNATVLPGTSGTVTGTNALATAESGEPFHYGTGRASVWWQWTAPVAGQAAFDTNGSNFDTVLAVYTGNSFTALPLIAKDDDGGSGVNSAVTFNATAGTTYKIAVDSFGTTTTGNITLNYQMNTMAPAVTLAPVDAVAGHGGNATFIAAGSGLPAPVAQWQRRPGDGGSWADLDDGPGVSGAKSAALTVSGVTDADQGAEFRCVFTNSVGSAVTNAAALTVNPPTFAQWAGLLGLSGNSALATARPYGDGLSNLARYAMNIGAAPAPGELPSISPENDGGQEYLTITYRLRKNLTGVTLTPVYSNNLAQWTPVPAENMTRLPDADAQTEVWRARVPVPSGGAPVFLGIEATLAQ